MNFSTDGNFLLHDGCYFLSRFAISRKGTPLTITISNFPSETQFSGVTHFTAPDDEHIKCSIIKHHTA